MKKYLLIILLSLYFINAKAQAWIYHPMPDTNAVWRVDWHTSSICPPMSLFATYQYTIGGDTIIGIHSYKKIYSSGISGICNLGPSYFYGYAGAMRQDIPNKKVYFICPGGNDSILYNFNLNIGDTVKQTVLCIPESGGVSTVIASIDSVMVGSSYHKKFNCTDGTQIIEGVGSTGGLIEEHFTFESVFDLICFSHDTDNYPFTSTSCPLVDNSIGVFEINPLIDELKIVPNPINTEGVIELTKGNDIIKDICIYNSLGIMVGCNKNIFKKEYLYYADELKSGIYILKVMTQKNNLFISKLIVN